jgi:hypothetical protein
LEEELTKNFVGLSGHLRAGATGHYEGFHKGLYDALCESQEFKETIYLGSNLSEPSWFQTVVPPSLVSKHSWCSKKYRRKLQEIAENRTNSVFHIYEGNLFQMFILSELLRKDKTSVAVLNLFDSTKLGKTLSSRIRKYFFKKLFLIALRDLEGRLKITADTYRMGKQLEKLLNVRIFTYPMYSILKEKEMKTSGKNEYLFMIRGNQAMVNLIESLKSQNSDFLKKVTVHGVPTHEQIYFSEDVLGISVSKKHLSEEEYSAFFKRFSHIVFLYDPELFRNQSSGRLCDALVAEAHVIVPLDCALWDSASEYGGYSEFKFEVVDEAIDVIAESRNVQYPRTTRPLPEAKRAVTNLLDLLHNAGLPQSQSHWNLKFRVTFSLYRKYQYVLRLHNAISTRIEGRLSGA